MKTYKAVILAAGQGTRLRPLTDHIPKCMVEAAGKPLIEWQLDVMNRTGIVNVVAVTGYKQEKITDSRLQKVFNPDFASTNMIYSLFCAEPFLEGDVLIAYGDIVYSEEVLRKVMGDEHDIVIACDEEWLAYWSERFEDPLSDAETFKKGDGKKVLSLGKKPETAGDIEGQYIGLIKLSENGCRKIREAYHACRRDENCNSNAWGGGRTLRQAYMTDLLNHFAAIGELHYCSIHRGWVEVDDHTDLTLAESKIPEIAG